MARACISVVMLMLVGLWAGGCDRSIETPVATSDKPQVTTTTGQLAHVATTSGATEAGFVWRPDTGTDLGSHVANRMAFGIVEGDEKTLFFQAINTGNGPIYSLRSLDVDTKTTRKLSDDCGGMINVSGNSVFYAGSAVSGIFRYDIGTNSVEQLYSKDVSNLLVVQGYIYFIDSIDGFCRLCQMDEGGGEVTVAARNVIFDYLQESNGLLYFARETTSDGRCEILKMPVGTPDEIMSVCEVNGQPRAWLGTQILFADGAGEYLQDVRSGAQTRIISRPSDALVPAVNGNGMFYTTIDRDGYVELWVLDLESGITHNLMPVHCPAVYFIDGTLYLVDPVDLGFERVILDSDDPHTEWVVKRGVAAR